MSEDEITAALNAAKAQWDELERVAVENTEDAHAMIGALSLDDLRFLVLERVGRETSAERAMRYLSGKGQ